MIAGCVELSYVGYVGVTLLALVRLIMGFGNLEITHSEGIELHREASISGKAPRTPKTSLPHVPVRTSVAAHNYLYIP